MKRDEQTQSLGSARTQTGARLRLLVFLGSEVLTFPLERKREIVVGRDPHVDIPIEHVTVSRKHASIFVTDRLQIVDHGSHNGTRIGGKRLAPNVPTDFGISTVLELGAVMVIIQLDLDEAVVASSRAPSLARAPASGLSEAMQHLDRLIDHVADSNLSVIVRGETGAGKEVISEAIHERSGRALHPLVRLNCAALPETLLEGELFGYERGAFTGANAAKPGLIEAAHGGTLFLDEVGELPLATQAKLLRVVESREVMRLGSLKPRLVDLRLVTATHRDLEAMVADGTFRSDLYYRLNGVSLWVPPLRERREEIRHLAHLLLKRAREASKRPALRISEAAIAALEAHSWPGNVRELRNVIERAAVFCKTGEIGPDHLDLSFGGSRSGSVPVAVAPPSPRSTPQIWAAGGPPPAHPVEASSRLGAPSPAPSLPSAVGDFERKQIIEALDRCDGNQTQAAALLGISRRTLLRRLDEFRLPRPRK